MKTLVIACSLWLVASTAHAAIITIDPNDFPLGTDLSTMFDGVTLSRVRNQPGQTVFSPVLSPVTVVQGANLGGLDVRHLGNYSFVDEYRDCTGPFAQFAFCGGYSVLEIAFTQATDYVSVWGEYWLDAPWVYMYDSTGAQINGPMVTQTTFIDIGHSARRFSVNRPTADISRVVFGGNVGHSLATQVEFNQETHRVPEPTTLLMMAAGAIVMLRRRASVK